ncbi:SRPBCC family protein [Aquihabitans daechungensis]|uniref:SRPBCC family protein n=1 Tax=Aquihabitans daechungensis TaxID=1052257 RepID=UPI003BA1946F
MKKQHLSVHVESNAPPEAVWALASDITTWTTWAPFDRAELERPGSHEPDGVGAIRVFHRGRYVTREEVTEFEPGRRLAYRLLSGFPLDDYTASITLTPTTTGTDIHWESTFRARRFGTGWIYRKGMTRLYREFARLLGVFSAQLAQEGVIR